MRFVTPIQRLLRYRPGKLAANTLVSSFWQFFRLAGQVAFIVIIARTLGPAGYGALAGFAGMAMILGGLTGMGGSYLLLQGVARRPETFSHHWHATLRIIAGSSLPVLGLYVLCAPALLKTPAALPPLLAIAISELLLYPLVYACGFAFQAHESLGWAGAMPATMAGCRLAGATLFLLTGVPHTFGHYAAFHLGASLAATLIAVLIVQLRLRPRWSGGTYSWREIRYGLGFSLANFTTNAYADLDKVLAVRYLGTTVAGSYTIAYRLIMALVTPIVSLALAAQPRIFRHAHEPGAQPLRHMLLLMGLAAAGYTAVASGAVLLISPFLTDLLGNAFKPAIRATQLLLPALPLFGFRFLAATLLASLGHPLQRAAIEAAGLLLLTVAATQLMPRYGLHGIIATVLAAETFLLVAMGAAATRAMRARGRP